MTLASGGEGTDLARDPVVEAGSEVDQQVAALHRRHGGVVAVHAGHAQRERVGVGEGAAGHQRGDDWDPGPFGEGPERLGRPRLEHTPAHVEHRSAGLGDQLGGLAHQHRVAERHRVVSRQVQLVDRLRPVPLHGRVRYVLRQVDEHRTGASRRRDVEGSGDHPWDFLHVFDQPVVLGDAHGDAGDVALLEGVRPDGGRRHLARDHDERRRVHVGVGQRRDDVGRSRSARHHGDTGSARDHGVPLGHVARPLLVAHQDVADGGVDDRVVDREDGAARQAEHHVDPLHLEALDEGLRPCQLHLVLPVALSASSNMGNGPELKRPPGAGGR